MAMMAQVFSLSGLETETGIDRRKLGSILKGVAPDGKIQGRDGWFISTLLAAMSSAGGELNPAAEKARLDKARADKTEVELAQMRGELVPASEVSGLWQRVVGRFRTVLLAVPGNVAARAKPTMKPSEIEALIREGINGALAELANTKVEGGDGERDASRVRN